jgi:hypothetical protein
MEFPTRAEIRKALLLALADDAPHYSDDVEVAVADILGLSDSHRRALAGNGRGTSGGVDARLRRWRGSRNVPVQRGDVDQVPVIGTTSRGRKALVPSITPHRLTANSHS